MNRFLIVRLASKFFFLKEYINSLKSEKGLEGERKAEEWGKEMKDRQERDGGEGREGEDKKGKGKWERGWKAAIFASRYAYRGVEKLLNFKKIMTRKTNQPTDLPANQQTDGQTGSQVCFTSKNSRASCWVLSMPCVILYNELRLLFTL